MGWMMAVTVELPRTTGGSPPSIVIPSRTGTSQVDLELPRNQGPQGIPGARYTDIGFGLKGSVTDPVTIPVTRETAIIDGSLAEATGTGSIAIDLDGAPVGSVSFPSGVFSFVVQSIGRGFLTFTPSGSLSDVSIAIAGER